jgi:antitoxin HicB
MNNKHIGSTLQSFFDELGEGEEFRLVAQKKAFVIAAEQRMAALKVSKNALAKRMGTSRPAIDRLLDPNNTSLTFASLNRATQALGLGFSLAFFEAKPRKASPRGKNKAARQRARKARSPASRAA